MFRAKLSFLLSAIALLAVVAVNPVVADQSYSGKLVPVKLSLGSDASASGRALPTKSGASAPPRATRSTPTPAAVPAEAPLANSENSNPVMIERFKAFRAFVKEHYGVELFIRSGWRSTEEQAQLYNSRPGHAVAQPGTSQHEKGQAIDYGPIQTWEINRHLGQFGLQLTVPGEPWHIEIVEPH